MSKERRVNKPRIVGGKGARVGLSRPSSFPVGRPLRTRVQSRSRNMVSSKAKNGFNCVSCGSHRAR